MSAPQRILKYLMITLMFITNVAFADKDNLLGGFLYRCDFKTKASNNTPEYHQVGHLLTYESGESSQLILSSDYPDLLQARIYSWQTYPFNLVKHITVHIVNSEKPVMPVEGGLTMVRPGKSEFALKVDLSDGRSAELNCKQIK